MKYLLLDTQIFLDFAVNRQAGVAGKLVSLFISLLNNGEIKLIVPALVKYETSKHLETEILKIDTVLDKTIRQIESIYWVNGIEGEYIDLSEYKKKSKSCILELRDIFNKQKVNYISEATKGLNEIFGNSNTIVISEDHSLLQSVLQRKIYKRAPLHKEKKESNGDALIIETLINIRKFIDLVEGDRIFFVTRNTTDFSEDHGDNKKELHRHIVQDIEVAGLSEYVAYRINLPECIMKDCEQEITNAKIKKEFELEFAEVQAIEEAERYRAFEENLREAHGLPSLESFEDMHNQELLDDENAQKIVELYESLGEKYSELRELYYHYTEILSILDTINQCTADSNNIINRFNEFLSRNKERFCCYTIGDIVDWINMQIDKVDIDTEKYKMPDYIDMDETVCFVDENKNELCLTWEDTVLEPESGELHTVYCLITTTQNSVPVCRGYININYGFVHEDDEGNVGDACEAEIYIELQDVVELIEQVDANVGILANRQQRYVEEINIVMLAEPV